MDWASLVAQIKKRICLQCRRSGFSLWVKTIPWKREQLPTPVVFSGKSHGQRSLEGYSHGVAKGQTQLSDRMTIVLYSFPGGSHGKEEYASMQEIRVQTLGQEDPVEKEMATHSSVLAWRIPWTREPRGLQSIASQRVRCY